MYLERSNSKLAQEYDSLSQLFERQPISTQRSLEQQAVAIVSALSEGKRICYKLPERIILEGGESLDLPDSIRRQTLKKTKNHSARLENREQLVRHLHLIEQRLNPGLVVCNKLIRYALGYTIIHRLLPDGRGVDYQLESGDDIPSIPPDTAPSSAMFAATDVTPGAELTGENKVNLQVPYVSEATRFYLPQWVAFGKNDRLLLGSLAEAKANIASLESAVCLLQDAAAICPSVVTDPAYQRKRAGLLGQLVNQGRALARAYTQEIILKIHSRASNGTLNRGLSLSLPYFDDGDLTLRTYPIQIIPNGRTMFAPAFVVLAMQKVEDRVRNDYRLNSSTRKHLFDQLMNIENAFLKSPIQLEGSL